MYLSNAHSHVHHLQSQDDFGWRARYGPQSIGCQSLFYSNASGPLCPR